MRAQMSSPEEVQNIVTSFCSWCAAWKTNGEIEGIGYLEPNPDPQVRSHQEDIWFQGLSDLVKQQDEKLEPHDDKDSSPEDETAATRFSGPGIDAQDNVGIKIGDASSESNAVRAVPDEPPPRRLTDVLECARTCLLCGKIWSTFEKWATEKYGSPNRLELPTSRVDIAGLWPKRLPEGGERSDDYAGYTDDGIHGRLCFVQVSISVHDPAYPPRLLGPSVTLQKSLEQAPNVADIFNSVDAADDEPLAWPDTEPYIARRRPLVADLRLFRKWKRLCEATHDDRCRPGRISFGPLPLRAIRLVDVEKLCIVETNDVESVSWVALSYVWGAIPFRTLTRDTLEELKMDGALEAPWVPATVADAIVVTRGLGERYLWTDSLCIIQDSDADKMNFVPCMDVIYGRAVLTIINAAGDSAFSGLPGVRPGTRFHDEAPFAIQDGHDSDGGTDADSNDRTWFMQTLEPVRTTNEILGDSHWFTRGWTFQEAILSQRWLVFTPEQVYWECRQATWREDACWELPPHQEQGRKTIIYDPAFYDGAFQDLWNLSSTQSFDLTYQCLVHSYAKRNLTYESDGLAAFSGILRAMTHMTGQDFLWGLPKRFLGVALTWPCCRERTRRRTEQCWLEVPVETKNSSGGSDRGSRSKMIEANFPSWAWVGWVCQVYFQELFGNLDGEHAGLEFYHVVEDRTAAGDDDTDEAILILQHIPQNDAFRYYKSEYTKSFESTNPLWRGNTLAPVSVSDIPSALLAPEMRFSVLAVWTSVAELYVGHDEGEPKRSDWEGENFSLWVDGDTRLDVMWDQYPPLVKEQGQQGNGGHRRSRVTCIVIGRDSLERLRGHGQLRVLLVKRHPSGGMCRDGQVVVWEDDWNRLVNRKWEMVFLI